MSDKGDETHRQSNRNGERVTLQRALSVRSRGRLKQLFSEKVEALEELLEELEELYERVGELLCRAGGRFCGSSWPRLRRRLDQPGQDSQVRGATRTSAGGADRPDACAGRVLADAGSGAALASTGSSPA